MELTRPEAIVSQVVINGEALSPLWQEPFHLDLGGRLQKGKNTIAVRLTNSLRNLMGPHHNADGERYDVGPDSFPGTLKLQRGHLVDNRDYRKDYNLVPFGLSGDVVLYY